MDAIQLAAQLGRLDFVSALLAAVALLLAFSAVPLFYFLRLRAETVAREEISAQMEKLTSDLEAKAISKMEGMLPALVKDYMDFAKIAAEAEKADDFARQQEDG